MILTYLYENSNDDQVEKKPTLPFKKYECAWERENVK